MTWYDNTPSKLYHTELGIPPNAKTQHGQMLLEYSGHALNAAQSDRFSNIINLPKVLDTSEAQVIEVEMNGPKTTKVLYRVPYDEEHDLILAVIPDRRYVKTVWLNRKDDLHRTLDPTRYEIPEIQEIAQVGQENPQNTAV